MISLEELIAQLPLDRQIAIRDRTNELIAIEEKRLADATPDPEISRDFKANACPQVQEAKAWRRRFKLPDDPQDDLEYARCEFDEIGRGRYECGSCELVVDGYSSYFPMIEEYYKSIQALEERRNP